MYTVYINCIPSICLCESRKQMLLLLYMCSRDYWYILIFPEQDLFNLKLYIYIYNINVVCCIGRVEIQIEI